MIVAIKQIAIVLCLCMLVFVSQNAHFGTVESLERDNDSLGVEFAFIAPTETDLSSTERSPVQSNTRTINKGNLAKTSGWEVIVLGIAQDAGYPQAGCKKACCERAWKDPSLRRFASSVAVVDHDSGQRWVLDCSPDFPDQLRLLDEIAPVDNGLGIDGIFLTHAHIGHYAGLIHLGREVMGAEEVPVYAMPRMQQFLEQNGPWEQLVKLKNISIKSITEEDPIQLNDRLQIQAIKVPHRDEYSETVGFIITGPEKKILYLPDIDKWSRWDRSVNKLVQQVDIAMLDGTFFANGEIPGRDMNQIPHPFVEESVAQFANLERKIRERIYFIHLNHTNPALNPASTQRQMLERSGLRTVTQGQRFRF